MHKLKSFFTNTPVFVYLLPVFFVLHGFTDHYGNVPVRDAFLLAVLYIGIAVLMSFLFRLLYKNFYKANIAAFTLLCIYFFFGSLHDTLKSLFPGAFIVKYSVLLPLLAACFIILIISLFRRNISLKKTTAYLNLFLIIIIAGDCLWLPLKMINYKKEELATLGPGLTVCDTCNKPDVYLIVVDEYAGYNQLSEKYNFKNDSFYDALRSRGFHISLHSRGNYNWTSLSVASILNMSYLQLQNENKDPFNIDYCYSMIRNSQVVNFFQHYGYDFYNYSIFNFKDQPSLVQEALLPIKTKLITGQTLLSRIERDLNFYFLRFSKIKTEKELIWVTTNPNNKKLYNLTLKTASTYTKHPKFIYTHLLMPHFPYYYDKDGAAIPYEKMSFNINDRPPQYVEYLQYTNKKLLELLDHIFKNSKQDPVIILMSDHGNRDWNPETDRNYLFMTLNAVHLPSKNHSMFYDSISNVNLFRNVLNAQFNQKLPHLQDSTIFLYF